jgi:hypothetical protein
MVERYETRQEKAEARKERREARRERASASTARVLERLDSVYDNLRASRGQRAVRVYEMLIERLEAIADRTRNEKSSALIKLLIADIQDEIASYEDSDPVMDEIESLIESMTNDYDTSDDFTQPPIIFDAPSSTSENLPRIVEYVATYYPQAQIVLIEREEDNDEPYMYEVELSNRVELYFDANFDIVAIDDSDLYDDDYDDLRIDTASAPAAILEFVATYYPQAQIVLIEREEDNDEPYMYEVELSNRVELYFDANFDVIKIDDSDLYDDDYDDYDYDYE